MTKNEYLAELKSRLMSIPSEERDTALKYYLEFFEDAGVENEQKVIEELGTPMQLAESIVIEQNRTEKSSTQFIPANINTKGNYQRQDNVTKQTNTVGNIILIILIIILASPIVLPVVATLFGIVVSIFAVIFAVWIACGAIVLALSVSGIALFFAGLIRMFTSPLEGLIGVGVGLILFAVGLLLIIPFVIICSKLIPSIIRGIVNLFSKIFNRKKVAN